MPVDRRKGATTSSGVDSAPMNQDLADKLAEPKNTGVREYDSLKIKGLTEAQALGVVSGRSIKAAQEIMEGVTDGAHDKNHMAAVAAFARRICNKTRNADRLVVDVSAYWHDVGRRDVGKGHEELGAKMAKNDLLGRGAPADFAQGVFDAIVNHQYGMTPQTLEGHIIRDADKLDFLGLYKWTGPVREKIKGRIPSLEERRKLIDMIPRLRDEILNLPASREIFDDEFPKFVKTMGALANMRDSQGGESTHLREIRDFHMQLREKMPAYRILDDRYRQAGA